jgi:hypothetical protein
MLTVNANQSFAARVYDNVVLAVFDPTGTITVDGDAVIDRCATAANDAKQSATATTNFLIPSSPQTKAWRLHTGATAR